MARYAQNTTIGTTCPWGSGDASLPDAFTLAEMKAAGRRQSKEAIVTAAAPQ
ncbi:Scn11a, partial [Symbiodinium pilosum]